MASNYPTSLDALSNPLSSNTMLSPSHSAQHANANDAIEAIQATLGISPQGGSATVAARCAALESGKASLGGSVSFSGTVGAAGLAGTLLSTAAPLMNSAVESAGSSLIPSRQDHVHPSDTSRAALSGATFTGDVVVSKATPTVTVSGSGVSTLISNSTSTHADVTARSASGGYARVNLDRPAGQFGAVFFKTAASQRWLIAANGDSESGSNAGTNLQITAYDDAGTALFSPLVITRATGKTTFGSVGASAGIEYGTNGPRDMVGTGSPEGVVTAPVGSTWRDTAATTGAIKWIKASGTGNTGWRVEYGDTGWRTLTGVLEPGASAGDWQMKRRGSTVTHRIYNATNASGPMYLIPSGFRIVTTMGGTGDGTALSVCKADGTTGGAVLNTPTANGITLNTGMKGYTGAYFTISYETDNAWPSTLPGTAA